MGDLEARRAHLTQKELVDTVCGTPFTLSFWPDLISQLLHIAKNRRGRTRGQDMQIDTIFSHLHNLSQVLEILGHLVQSCDIGASCCEEVCASLGWVVEGEEDEAV